MATRLHTTRPDATKRRYHKIPARALLRRAEGLLHEIDRRLRVQYGCVPVGAAPLGNKRNPLNELVYIQLSVRTREGTYQSTYPSLRKLVGARWEQLLTIPARRILSVLVSGGMARVKLARLRKTMEAIRERFGRVTLAPLHSMSDEDAERFLRTLPGVGPKVARCILLYSLDRDVFPVDSNCLRILRRVGLLPPSIDRKAAHDFLQQLVPPQIRRSLHVNLVHHGRRICIPAEPRCAECVLADRCKTGRERLRRVRRERRARR